MPASDRMSSVRQDLRGSQWDWQAARVKECFIPARLGHNSSVVNEAATSQVITWGVAACSAQTDTSWPSLSGILSGRLRCQISHFSVLPDRRKKHLWPSFFISVYTCRSRQALLSYHMLSRQIKGLCDCDCFSISWDYPRCLCTKTRGKLCLRLWGTNAIFSFELCFWYIYAICILVLLQRSYIYNDHVFI